MEKSDSVFSFLYRRGLGVWKSDECFMVALGVGIGGSYVRDWVPFCTLNPNWGSYLV
jgi:hypothetical protein